MSVRDVRCDAVALQRFHDGRKGEAHCASRGPVLTQSDQNDNICPCVLLPHPPTRLESTRDPYQAYDRTSETAATNNLRCITPPLPSLPSLPHHPSQSNDSHTRNAPGWRTVPFACPPPPRWVTWLWCPGLRESACPAQGTCGWGSAREWKPHWPERAAQIPPANQLHSTVPRTRG